MPLYAHQQKTVDFCHEHPRIHDWSDCGTGKTRAHLEAFRAAPLAGRALVLAPLSILESAWLDDLRRFTPTLRASIAYARNREAAFKAEADLVITNHDATTWIAAQAKRDKHFLAEFTHLICDEVTAYKHLAGRGNAARARALADIRHHFERRRLLTGTPASGSVLDLWALGYLCDDGKRLGTSFFAYRNSVTTPIQVGPSTNMIQWKEKPGAIDIVTKQLADITIRHRREDCIDIPPNHKYTLYTSLDSTSRQLYDEMHRDSLLALDSGAVVDAIHAGARAVKLLQICTGAVYDGEHIAHLIHQDRYRMVIDLVQERPWPCLVLFNWRHEADQLAALATAAKLPHGIMNGDTSVDDRIALVRAFQAGELRLLIAHPGTVAHGLTLTTGRTTIWSSPTYRAEYFLQANARIDRNGQQHPTETIMIAARDTREELVYDMLQGKVDRVSSLLHLMTNLQT